MAKSECKKCHKPLVSGSKCDACKQKDKDNKKSVGGIALTVLGIVGTAVFAVLKNNKKDS